MKLRKDPTLLKNKILELTELELKEAVEMYWSLSHNGKVHILLNPASPIFLHSLGRILFEVETK